MTLIEAVLWALGGGIGIGSSILVAAIVGGWPWLARARDWIRFAFAWLIACALVLVAYLFMIWLGEWPMPATLQDWAKEMFPYCFVACTASLGWFQARKPKPMAPFLPPGQVPLG